MHGMKEKSICEFFLKMYLLVKKQRKQRRRIKRSLAFLQLKVSDYGITYEKVRNEI